MELMTTTIGEFVCEEIKKKYGCWNCVECEKIRNREIWNSIYEGRVLRYERIVEERGKREDGRGC